MCLTCLQLIPPPSAAIYLPTYFVHTNQSTNHKTVEMGKRVIGLQPTCIQLSWAFVSKQLHVIITEPLSEIIFPLEIGF